MTVEQIELRKILSQMLADNGINRKCNRIIGIKPSFHWSFERRKVMKRQIRRGVFETNSSSTHSLTMCSEEEFEKWKVGEVLFDEWGRENFIKPYVLSDKQRQGAAEEYKYRKQDFCKDFEELTDIERSNWYNKYANKMGISGSGKTYDEYMRNGDLETFVSKYTSISYKIVAFGEYGYDG